MPNYNHVDNSGRVDQYTTCNIDGRKPTNNVHNSYSGDNCKPSDACHNDNWCCAIFNFGGVSIDNDNRRLEKRNKYVDDTIHPNNKPSDACHNDDWCCAIFNFGGANDHRGNFGHASFGSNNYDHLGKR